MVQEVEELPTQRIAVEEGLQAVGDYLRNQGYEVVDLSAENLRNTDCDCCVISGGDKNMMGMADITSGVSVINAEGMTPEEVHQEVQERVRLQ